MCYADAYDDVPDNPFEDMFWKWAYKNNLLNPDWDYITKEEQKQVESVIDDFYIYLDTLSSLPRYARRSERTGSYPYISV